MKHIGIYTGALAVLVSPALLFAQTDFSSGTLQVLMNLDNSSNIFENVSLGATLVVAFATSVMVWNLGRKMHGGVFGSVLNLFSIGMLFVFLGFAVGTPWLQVFDSLYLKMAHDSLYIIGYIMMGLAANKLLKVIKGE